MMARHAEPGIGGDLVRYSGQARNEARNELLSLLNVKPFNPRGILIALSEIEAIVEKLPPVESDQGYTVPNKFVLQSYLIGLAALCDEAGLAFSRPPIFRLHAILKDQPLLYRPLSVYMFEIRSRIEDELEQPRFMAIPLEKFHYFNDRGLFGLEVNERFGSATADIEEAGKCYAAGRNTACVFHSMRVMEIGLRALGKSLNDPTLDPKRNPNWGELLRKGDEELKKPLKNRCAEWQADEPFFSTAHANLRAVKDAWRNLTMHVEQNYNEETALEVFNAVKGFMRHLATKLKE